ncbi:BCL-6 corepressor-like protein 1 [Cebus imitator]|uniref:BCL-6 corepressor-like protein 1 n=1 Tax=Cebus imitator TaxID=2715852 RepID=UPI00080A2CC8|nr:BCL-6 corepressor-like protein 1 [Cebus imitator]
MRNHLSCPRVLVEERPPKVSPANLLRGPAPLSPPPVIVYQGPRGVAAQAAWVPLPATAPAAVPGSPGKPSPTPRVSPRLTPVWWASFFFRKSILLFMAMVLRLVEHPESPQASSSMTTWGLALDTPGSSPVASPAQPALDPHPDLSRHHQPQVCEGARPPDPLPCPLPTPHPVD